MRWNTDQTSGATRDVAIARARGHRVAAPTIERARSVSAASDVARRSGLFARYGATAARASEIARRSLVARELATTGGAVEVTARSFIALEHAISIRASSS